MAQPVFRECRDTLPFVDMLGKRAVTAGAPAHDVRRLSIDSDSSSQIYARAN
jgi:hypothetical protein